MERQTVCLICGPENAYMIYQQFIAEFMDFCCHYGLDCFLLARRGTDSFYPPVIRERGLANALSVVGYQCLPISYLLELLYHTNILTGSVYKNPVALKMENSRTGGENSPSWEMGHFAVGEVAYFNHFLKPRQYNKLVGFLGISELRNFKGHIWFGADLVDSLIDQLVSAAVSNNSRPGPVYSRWKSYRFVLLQDAENMELQDDG
ncbi:hypothetical protein EG68_06221 [Paragonimus skrjabini miyazakii]|uniref:Uncharacterized protein n=1 Tax=Paragonimus skrjabini miyazakii TaxID=59628 RepID=A0A8S9YPA6_9TREM|nr:hypothetical protein EG68_06221 [Paragonimus skrjabini miyazakii]